MYAVAGACPKVSEDIDAETIVKTVVTGGENTWRSQSSIDNNVFDKVVRSVDVIRNARIRNVKVAFIGREGEAIWFLEPRRDPRNAAQAAVDTIHIAAAKFRTCDRALPVRANAVIGICKPDRTVGFSDNVTWGIESFPVDPVR